MRVLFTFVGEVVESCNRTAVELAERIDVACRCGDEEAEHHYRMQAKAFELIAKVAQRQIDKLSVSKRK